MWLGRKTAETDRVTTAALCWFSPALSFHSCLTYHFAQILMFHDIKFWFLQKNAAVSSGSLTPDAPDGRLDVRRHCDAHMFARFSVQWTYLAFNCCRREMLFAKWTTWREWVAVNLRLEIVRCKSEKVSDSEPFGPSERYLSYNPSHWGTWLSVSSKTLLPDQDHERKFCLWTKVIVGVLYFVEHMICHQKGFMGQSRSLPRKRKLSDVFFFGKEKCLVCCFGPRLKSKRTMWVIPPWVLSLALLFLFANSTPPNGARPFGRETRKHRHNCWKQKLNIAVVTLWAVLCGRTTQTINWHSKSCQVFFVVKRVCSTFVSLGTLVNKEKELALRPLFPQKNKLTQVSDLSSHSCVW